MCEVITAELEASDCMSLRACCSALDVARAGYYRFRAAADDLDRFSIQCKA